MKLMLLGIVTCIAVFGVLWMFGRRRWARRTAAILRKLEAVRIGGPAQTFDPRELEGLPAPIISHLTQALPCGTAIVRAIEVTHRGTFNMAAAGQKWKPFTSRQRVITRRPAFMWDARISMGPGLKVFVHDAYAAEEGILEAAIGGVFMLAEMHDNQEAARGELMRFFAEAPWYPTALLPSQGVKWEPIDDKSAKGTLSDGQTVVSMTFSVGADGLIETIRAASRGRAVGDEVIPTAWEGRMSDYGRSNGLFIPMSAEVAWLTEDGQRLPYYRGSVLDIKYSTENAPV